MNDTYTPEQIRQHREEWIAELRSGNRQQVQGYLSCANNNGDQGFCCLGVATVLAGVPGRQVERSHPNQTRYTRFGSLGDYLTLPHEAREWLGVSAADPHVGFDNASAEDWDFIQAHLDNEVYQEVHEAVRDDDALLTGALLNDKGATFAQIADIFEHFGFAPEHDLLVSEVAA